LGGDLLVYMLPAADSVELHGWRVSTLGPPFLIAPSGPHGAFDTDGNTVIWVERIAPNDHRIFSYDVATGQTARVLTTTTANGGVRVSGDWVVWLDDRNGPLEVRLFDLAEGVEYVLAGGPQTQYGLAVDGNNIVYISEGHIRLITVERSVEP